MDEQEKKKSEFSLEDIMREFGAVIPEPEEEPAVPMPAQEAGTAEKPAQMPDAAEAPEQTPAEPEQGIPEGEEPAAEADAAPRPEAPEMREGDTIRLPDTEPEEETQPPVENLEQTRKLEAIREDAMVRLDDIAQVVKDTPPLDMSPAPVPEEEKVEPFSENWEPEYEQPMGEYVPPQPILFHPRSRLRELKRKLIAGPEKRYYEISEEGFGKLQIAIILSLLVFLMSAGATAMNAAGLILESRMKFMIFVQFFGMLVSALLGSFQMIEGVADLFRKRFTLNSLLAFTFIICCIDGFFCFGQLRIPCCAAFSLAVTMSLWSSYQRRNTEMGQMDTMRKAVRLDSLVTEPDCYDGKPGVLRGEGQVEDFMDNYRQTPKTEKVLQVYALVVLGVSLVIGVVGAVLHGVDFGFQVMAAALLVGMPVSAFVCSSRPMALLEKRLHSVGTVICGWKGIQALSGKMVFPLSHEDLFPVGTAKLNGVKFYGSREPDQIVAYATALIVADNGALAPLFTQLLDSRKGHHYDVKNFRYYGSGGIGGEVCGEPVLVGVLPFLREMGVEIPDGTRVNQAVYVAIDGELYGLFAVSYQKDKSSAAGLTSLCAYKDLTPVLTSSDFMLTESFLRSKFSVNTRRVAFPSLEARAGLKGKKPSGDAQAAALVTRDGLAPLAYAVTGARAVRKSWIAGNVVHMLGGILGLVMMLTLAILGAAQLLTPLNMLLYQLIWLIPGLLITEWTRSI